MNLDLRYLGRSSVAFAAWGLAMRFSPNLARLKVFFDGEVVHPVRFREAISALHDVVIGDLRIPKPDRTAWEEWKKDEARRESELRERVRRESKDRELLRLASEPVPPNLERDFRRMHDVYWRARRQWADELSRNDPELFRHLVPCDPVVTVASDVVFFECFSKDESSYGCLSVDRGAFRDQHDSATGTTNVDYSIGLYEHFQTLRTYRPTRLLVDPTGFEVKVEGREDYREEKIDLPPTWLRGFGQLQSAMALPARTVELPVESVYAILAWLKRHREKTGPRALRFELTPGVPPTVVLEPWGVRVQSHGAPYRGPKLETIQVWGRRRLFALARLLPLAERIQVRLLGSGMPSVWIADLGEMRFVLALSGWTANDWTSGASLDLLASTAGPASSDGRGDAAVTEQLRRYLAQSEQATLPVIEKALGAPRDVPHDVVIASLHELAREGQVVYDFAGERYRWRQVMPFALSEEVLGPPPPEVGAGRALVNKVRIERDERVDRGRRLIAGKVENTSVEVIFDADGRFSRARCSCSYFHKMRLRAGPCRHLLALQLASRKRDKS